MQPHSARSFPHLALPQVADLVARQAQLAQDFVAVLAQPRRATAEFGRVAE
jgi:hypothetical protein